MSKRSLNVGVVGLGNMGIPIARNLAFKARSAIYLQLHSRDPKKLKMVSEAISADGATCALRLHHRYRTVTKWCDVVMLALANRRAAARVLLEDEEALIPSARPGQIIVDHTTVDVELSRTCGIEAEKRGAFFLDAPMSGSPRAVFNNQLVLMVGGPAEYYQRLLPIFRMYADHIHHMGNHGSGTATKLISQALVASHNAAAAEAMTMANRLGIEDHRRLVQVLDASWGSSTMLRRNAGPMQDAIRSPDAVPPTSHASIDHLLEDLSLLDDSLPEPQSHFPSSHSAHPPSNHLPSSLSSSIMDEDGKERFPVLDASLRMLGIAQETGMGSRDLSAVVHFIQAAASMERKGGVAEERGGAAAGAARRGASASFLDGRHGTQPSPDYSRTPTRERLGVEDEGDYPHPEAGNEPLGEKEEGKKELLPSRQHHYYEGGGGGPGSPSANNRNSRNGKDGGGEGYRRSSPQDHRREEDNPGRPEEDAEIKTRSTGKKDEREENFLKWNPAASHGLSDSSSAFEDGKKRGRGDMEGNPIFFSLLASFGTYIYPLLCVFSCQLLV